jgi:cbb3-type cytochrome oxidase subunit 3
MNPATIIAVIAIALMLYFAIRYIYKEKKRNKDAYTMRLTPPCLRWVKAGWAKC